MNIRPMPYISEEDRIKFWSNIKIKGKNECWLWIGGRCGRTTKRFTIQYGNFNIKVNNIWKSYSCNRIAFYLHNNVDPYHLCVLHECDYPLCCNPNHLFLGTQQDNVDDCRIKNRFPRGETRGRNKLTEIKVKEIRHKRIFFERTYKSLADEYNMGETTIYNICNYELWKHI